MKILMIDRIGFQTNTRKMLIEDDLKCTVDTVASLGDLYIAFQKEKYEVVVIDNTIENGQKYIEHILQTDATQPILVVSDSIHCVIQRCEECANNYMIRRLFNPTPIHNIVRMIRGFSGYQCDHYDEETNKISNQ